MSTAQTQPSLTDAPERARALDPGASFLVQAPAGSGKTELLALRYLALLPYVDEPEQVLAITFTRKATAEMRIRVLHALEKAGHGEDTSENEHEQEVRRLAKAALAHAQTRGWRITEQPQRLNIQTIDALALSIAYQTPLLSRLGGQLTPVEDAMPLYAVAAERTLAHLGDTAEQELAEALSDILRLRDANLRDCESLIAGMLARRDQWLLLLPGIVREHPPWEEIRARLEEPFQREHAALIHALRAEFDRTPDVLAELLALASIACDCGVEEALSLREARTPDDFSDAVHWQALCCLLLTKSNGWRKRGIIPAKQYPDHAARLTAVVDRLSRNDTLLALLSSIRTLPPTAYSAQEWNTVRNIFIVLRHAIAQLRVVFAEENVIDFAEAGIAAHGAIENPSVLMRLEDRVQHLLIDEFQDTSRPHFALLRALIQDWYPGDGRTCFLVGDPMQSIYLFRDAESRLFHQVREHGMEVGASHLQLTALQLSTNFRSVSAIVQPVNEVFERVLGSKSDDEVQYSASTSSRPGTIDDAMHLHVQTFEKDRQSPDDLDAAEADAMIAVIRSHMRSMEDARRLGGKYRVAVLARARPHLIEIIRRLRQEQIPFRGVKIDLLCDRQEILDLLSLFRALLHPADRIAWLAVLRAPWCGLTIPALHTICGDSENAMRERTIPALIRSNEGSLDPESRRRVLYVLSILEHAQASYAAGALASSPAGLALWLERTWAALRAPQFLDDESVANCQAFFATLSQMTASCFGTLDESLNQRLEELYAQPDPNTSENCGVQLMTIHSAKGLEFEVVLVPQLHRSGKRDDPPLFHWLVRKEPGGKEDELLLAPIGYKHGDNPRLYDWVRKKSSRRFHQEEKRLLYVACSRAINELHLFAAVERKATGELVRPRKSTLLAAGWSGLERRFAQATQLVPVSNVLVMPRTFSSPLQAENGKVALAAAGHEPMQVLRRLPADCFSDTEPEPSQPPVDATNTMIAKKDSGGDNRLALVQGIVLHALLERLAVGASGDHPDWDRLAHSLLRQHGLSRADSQSAHDAVLRGLHNSLGHDEGRWLFAARIVDRSEQHRDERSWNETSWNETSWTSVSSGRMLRQRPDLVFFGGCSPGEPGAEYLWIVDYKTGSLPEGTSRESFLETSREQYRNQLESYSELFRELSDLDSAAAHRAHRLAIYHPMLPWLDWWPA